MPFNHSLCTPEGLDFSTFNVNFYDIWRSFVFTPCIQFYRFYLY